MALLLLVSVLWALSFGLTAQVSGLGAAPVAALRTFLAALVLLPFLRLRGLGARRMGLLLLTGAIQFGLMYLLYIAAFRWLRASEAALFTIFTPLFVTLFGLVLERRWAWTFLAAALLAVGGTAFCVWTDLGRPGLLLGFLLMQGANAAFALGQLLYRRASQGAGQGDLALMGLVYLGAAGFTALALLLPGAGPGPSSVLGQATPRQLAILAYLGVVASGLGFLLFNAGARRVDLGTLAVMNNLKIPLAILAAGLVFGERVDWLRLAIGGALLGGALAVNRRAGEAP